MRAVEWGPGIVEREVVLDAPIEAVFAFFGDPGNLNRITPPWLDFRIVSCSTATIGSGTLIDYRLRIRGVPIRWRSRILDWDPPHGFADEQVRGPYRKWIHHHSFEDLGGRTRCRDHVAYTVPGGALVDRLFVRPDVERIFDYRTEQLARILGRGT